jgi:phospholipid/cholesterol/gamma-HCH transport system substrate-binding protein
MSRYARLGAFVLGTLVILALGVFIIGGKESLFKPTYHVKAQFDNVVGLQAGAEVMTGGVHIGTVQAIELPHNPKGKVTVVMQLDRATRDLVNKGSIASIETEGLLGNQYMSISFGGTDSGVLNDGDFIAGQPPLLMADLFKKASGLLDGSQQAIQQAALATAHLNSITAKIDSGQGSVGALINDKTLYNNLEQTSGGMKDTITHAEAGVTDFQENMEALKHNFFLSGYFKKRGYEDSAQLIADEIESLPSGTPVKTFTIPAKKLFKGRDTANLKDQKLLKESGDYLSGNPFGVAVVVAATGMEGDAQKSKTLTEARSAVVREYLVENFGFDDSQLKTLGEGKQADQGSEDNWGTIQIMIYPAGTQMPPDKKSAAGAQASAGTTSKN